MQIDHVETKGLNRTRIPQSHLHLIYIPEEMTGDSQEHWEKN